MLTSIQVHAVLFDSTRSRCRCSGLCAVPAPSPAALPTAPPIARIDRIERWHQKEPWRVALQSTRTRPAVSRSSPRHDGLALIPTSRCPVYQVGRQASTAPIRSATFATCIRLSNAASCYCATHCDAGGRFHLLVHAAMVRKSGGLQLISPDGTSR